MPPRERARCGAGRFCVDKPTLTLKEVIPSWESRHKRHALVFLDLKSAKPLKHGKAPPEHLIPYYERESSTKKEQLPQLQGMINNSMWRGTTAYPDPRDPSKLEINMKTLLQHLAGFAPRRMTPAMVGHPPEEVFLYPPGIEPEAVSADTLDFEDKTRCITLCADSLKTKQGRNSRQRRGCSMISMDSKGGYYIVKVGKKGGAMSGQWRTERAHRLVLWSMFGPSPLPHEDLKERHPYTLVLHMCGNPSCLNPEHLVWGNDRINRIRDKEEAKAEFLMLLRLQGRCPKP
jgi:hypothetical protein